MIKALVLSVFITILTFVFLGQLYSFPTWVKLAVFCFILLLFEGNIGVFITFSSFFVGLAFLFKDFLTDVMSTFVLLILKPFDNNSVITYNGLPMTFSGYGFARSPLQMSNGVEVLVPNHILLNEMLLLNNP